MSWHALLLVIDRTYLYCAHYVCKAYSAHAYTIIFVLFTAFLAASPTMEPVPEAEVTSILAM